MASSQPLMNKQGVNTSTAGKDDAHSGTNDETRNEPALPLEIQTLILDYALFDDLPRRLSTSTTFLEPLIEHYVTKAVIYTHISRTTRSEMLHILQSHQRIVESELRDTGRGRNQYAGDDDRARGELVDAIQDLWAYFDRCRREAEEKDADLEVPMARLGLQDESTIE